MSLLDRYKKAFSESSAIKPGAVNDDEFKATTTNALRRFLPVPMAGKPFTYAEQAPRGAGLLNRVKDFADKFTSAKNTLRVAAPAIAGRQFVNMIESPPAVENNVVQTGPAVNVPIKRKQRVAMIPKKGAEPAAIVAPQETKQAEPVVVDRPITEIKRPLEIGKSMSSGITPDQLNNMFDAGGYQGIATIGDEKDGQTFALPQYSAEKTAMLAKSNAEEAARQAAMPKSEIDKSEGSQYAWNEKRRIDGFLPEAEVYSDKYVNGPRLRGKDRLAVAKMLAEQDSAKERLEFDRQKAGQEQSISAGNLDINKRKLKMLEDIAPLDKQKIEAEIKHIANTDNISKETLDLAKRRLDLDIRNAKTSEERIAAEERKMRFEYLLKAGYESGKAVGDYLAKGKDTDPEDVQNNIELIRNTSLGRPMISPAVKTSKEAPGLLKKMITLGFAKDKINPGQPAKFGAGPLDNAGDFKIVQR